MTPIPGIRTKKYSGYQPDPRTCHCPVLSSFQPACRCQPISDICSRISDTITDISDITTDISARLFTRQQSLTPESRLSAHVGRVTDVFQPLLAGQTPSQAQKLRKIWRYSAFHSQLLRNFTPFSPFFSQLFQNGLLEGGSGEPFPPMTDRTHAGHCLKDCRQISRE